MKRFLLVTLMLLASLTAFSQTIPHYTGYVNDFANILSPQTKTALADSISRYEKLSSIEIAIVTVSDLQGSYIEEYSMKLATEWGVGKKSQNNGLVMFVSTDKAHRGFRLEVGYGLEGIMTDYEARRITDPTVQQYFKHAKFDEGMKFALAKVWDILNPTAREQRAVYEAQRAKEQKESLDAAATTLGYVVACLVVLAIAFLVGRLIVVRAQEKRAIEHTRKQWQEGVIRAKRDVQKNIDAKISLLAPLEQKKFYGAKDAVLKLSIHKSNLETCGADGRMKEFYENELRIIQHIEEENQTMVDKVLSNAALAKEIDNDKKKFGTIKPTIEKLIEKNKKVATEIDKNNPKSVWTQTEPKVLPNVAFRAAMEYALKSASLYTKAQSAISDNNFEDAEKAHRGAHTYLDKAVRAANYPTALKKEIDAHEREAMAKFKQLDALKVKALKSVEREHVNATTKEMVKGIAKLEKDVAKAFTVEKDTLDWFVVLLAVMMLYNYLQRIIDTADSNIQSYNDAIRRKREEQEEEERRRRRRREEEEERHRSSYSSSYGSSYSSSHSSDSGGSSFGGFGGGSFGGGGSTSSW